MKPTKFSLWLSFFLVAVFPLYMSLWRVMPSLMARELMLAYHLNGQGLGHLAMLFYCIYIPVQLLAGLWVERYPLRYLMTFALVISSVGGFLFAHGSDYYWAMLGRGLFGFGAAFAFIGALKMAWERFSQKHFPILVGVVMSICVLGSLGGDLIVSQILTDYGWRLTCYLVSLAGLVWALFFFLLQSPVESINPRPRLRKIFVQSIVLLRDGQFWLNALVGCLLLVPAIGLGEVWLVPYFVHTGKLAYADAAISTGMLFLGWAIGAPLMGRLSEMLESRLLIMGIGAVVATILLSIVLYVPNLSLIATATILFLFGVFNSSQMLVYVIAVQRVSGKFQGVPIALIHMFLMLAGFSIYLVGFLLEVLWSGGTMNTLHIYENSTYQIAFAVFPVATFFGFLFSFFLKEE